MRKPATLRAGQQVLVWYHPRDPLDILVDGRDGRLGDRALLITGGLVMLIGIALAAADGYGYRLAASVAKVCT